jgi:hypothetical protein
MSLLFWRSLFVRDGPPISCFGSLVSTTPNSRQGLLGELP